MRQGEGLVGILQHAQAQQVQRPEVVVLLKLSNFLAYMNLAAGLALNDHGRRSAELPFYLLLNVEAIVVARILSHDEGIDKIGKQREERKTEACHYGDAARLVDQDR